jgi:GDSL-like Lipase/Acylhydrolase
MTAIHWKSAISGLFTTATDWIPGQVPTASDDVFITAVGTYTVTSSASRTVKTLTTASTATLAIAKGTFSITNGTGAGANAGTISVGDAAALAIGGQFKNAGEITLNPTTHKTGLAIIGNTTLSGLGKVTLSQNGGSLIVSNGSAATLVNASTIAGAGTIGDAHLTLVNQGIIDGDSATAALTLDTNAPLTLRLPPSHTIGNSGLIEGTTAKGTVIVSNVSNDGRIEALGTDARLLIDGTISNFAPFPLGRPGLVGASGSGAHVDLSSTKITGGVLSIGAGSLIETVAGTGVSIISGVRAVNSGTLQANSNSELRIQSSTIGTTGTLMSNGVGALLDIDGSVGAVAGTISGGTIEFKGTSAAHIAFTPGTVGTLKLDASTTFTGTISGFGGLSPNIFSQFLGFGDSSIDSGALQYLPTANANQNIRIQSAVANGGSGSPVGVGLMNPQILAGDFGLTANSAYAPSGGTNYAISGAVDAAVSENGFISNVNPGAGLLATVDQISSYLNSTKDANGIAHADPNALYLISSGANDASVAKGLASAAQLPYMDEQAANLTAAIQNLVAAGAQHVIVNSIQGDSALEDSYSKQLFIDLDTAGVRYVKSDINGMLKTIQADLAAGQPVFGLDPNEAERGIQGTATESALVEPDTTVTFKGWGLWGANTTTQEDPSVPLNQQYAYLRSADAEQKSLFSDDQHLSAAGQFIQANYDYGLLVTDKVISQDALDLTDINYALGTTKATYSGNTAGGTLTVTDGTHVANIALLGNYMAAAFVTASDGGTGTLVVDQSATAQQPSLVPSHGTP